MADSDKDDIGFDEYQKLSNLATDQRGSDDEKAIAELINSLSRAAVSVTASHIQNTPDRTERVAQHLGDTLWYLAAVARRLNVPLSRVARDNLKKIEEHFGNTSKPPRLFDDDSPPHEQLPRKFTLMIKESQEKGLSIVRMSIETTSGPWLPIGNPINDNSYEEDDYRFHDVLHLAYMAKLGWSPVMRALFSLKRKSNPDRDRVDDGARAILLEESLTGFIYSHAQEREFYEKTTELDMELLRTVKRLTKGLEVKVRTYRDWTEAILSGYEMLRQIKKQRNGLVHVDMEARTIRLDPLPPEAAALPVPT